MKSDANRMFDVKRPAWSDVRLKPCAVAALVDMKV